MSTKRARKIFVNLPVRDLERSKGFFGKLGFEFNPQFTDDKAACMVLSEHGYVMLLVDERFKDFTKKDICDSSKSIEGIFALEAESRDEVDQLFTTATAAGATPAGDTMDMGFMYLRRFHDLDGHHWEVFFMDEAAMKQQQQGS